MGFLLVKPRSRKMMTNVWSSVKSNRLHIEASIIGIAFVLVGIYHFIDQDFFEAIVPTWFRYATFANLASGGAEIVLGLMLIVPKFRRVGAWGLRSYWLLCIRQILTCLSMTSMFRRMLRV